MLRLVHIGALHKNCTTMWLFWASASYHSKAFHCIGGNHGKLSVSKVWWKSFTILRVWSKKGHSLQKVWWPTWNPSWQPVATSCQVTWLPCTKFWKTANCSKTMWRHCVPFWTRKPMAALLAQWKTTLAPVSFDWPQNYLTKEDWEALDQANTWQAIDLLVSRYQSLGIHSVKESTKKAAIGLVVWLQVQKTGKIPFYTCIYQMVQHFTDAFQVRKPEARLCHTTVFPENPKDLPPNVLKAIYGEKHARSKVLPGLGQFGTAPYSCQVHFQVAGWSTRHQQAKQSWAPSPRRTNQLKTTVGHQDQLLQEMKTMNAHVAKMVEATAHGPSASSAFPGFALACTHSASYTSEGTIAFASSSCQWPSAIAGEATEWSQDFGRIWEPSHGTACKSTETQRKGWGNWGPTKEAQRQETSDQSWCQKGTWQAWC